MDIKEAKQYYLELKPCKKLIEAIDTDFFFNFAETVLSELDKKDKIIDKMAKEMFYENNRNVELQQFDNYEQIKEYFTNLVEREKGE